MSAHHALELLADDHRRLLALSEACVKATDPSEERVRCGLIADEWRMHATIEQRVLYPAVSAAIGTGDLMTDDDVERDSIDRLADSLSNDLDPVRLAAGIELLDELLRLHVRTEEADLFPLVRSLHVDLEALGLELLACRSRLRDRLGPLQGNP